MPRRRKTQEKAEQLQSKVYDPFRDFHGTAVELALARFFYFLRNHKKPMIVTVSTLSAAIVILVGYLIWNDVHEAESLRVFDELMSEPTMKVGSGAEQVALTKLDDYNEKFSNRNARQRANLHRLNLYVALGKLKEAAETSMKIVDDVKTPELQSYFCFKAGVYYENARMYDQCEIAYQRAGSLFQEDNYGKALALFGQGRCLHRLGKIDQARTALKSMMDMREVQNIEELRIAAASFLLGQSGP